VNDGGALVERTVVVDGLRLATAVNTVPRAQLARPALICLPAAGHTWRDYQRALMPLAAERRVAALDWPGFGASDHPAPAAFAYSARAYAGLLLPWLDALGLARVVALGNSVGAAAAVLLALAQPERVAGLALVAPGGFTPPGWRRRLACRTLGSPPLLAALEPIFTAFYLGPANPATRAIVAAHRAARRSSTYPATIAAYAALWRSFDAADAELTVRAQALTAPALVLRGALDPVISAADTRRAAAAVGSRGALQVVLPNAGHLPFLQQPSRFEAALRGLLETVEAS
jgi:pimeloyl-ACP methyl ester carboxylesterase